MKPRQKNKKLSWDDHHMLLALVTAQRSPDTNTQVGSVIVNQDNRILGLGYNGLPKGINNNLISWSRAADNPLHTKYPFVVHSEQNAIINSNFCLKNATIYTTLYPCNNCAKLIIQAGIIKVVYLENKYPDSLETKAADWMFQQVDIITRKHIWSDGYTECLQKLNQV